jgi:hypothetical protein
VASLIIPKSANYQRTKITAFFFLLGCQTGPYQIKRGHKGKNTLTANFPNLAYCGFNSEGLLDLTKAARQVRLMHQL